MKPVKEVCERCYNTWGKHVVWKSFEDFWDWGEMIGNSVCDGCKYELELELANQ